VTDKYTDRPCTNDIAPKSISRSVYLLHKGFMHWFSYRCPPIGVRVNLLCKVHVDTTILCSRNQKVKYILFLLYKLLRKRNEVTLQPRVCQHSKGTARQLVDIIPTIIFLINILITQIIIYIWKYFPLFSLTVTFWNILQTFEEDVSHKILDQDCQNCSHLSKHPIPKKSFKNISKRKETHKDFVLNEMGILTVPDDGNKVDLRPLQIN